MGVRSNTRAIMKISNVTYTYPGRDKPSLIGVSCALSLSSRVGIIGPNGAGKSTLIKVLTVRVDFLLLLDLADGPFDASTLR